MLRRAALGAVARLAARPAARQVSSSVAPPLRLDPALEGIISRFKAAGKGGPQEEKAKKLVDDFSQLQQIRVQRVLLVCSDYDSYTFEEEGLLTELVNTWYGENNLTKPPMIERVNSTEKALQRFKESNFDMVLSLLRMQGHKAFVSTVRLAPTHRRTREAAAAPAVPRASPALRFISSSQRCRSGCSRSMPRSCS